MHPDMPNLMALQLLDVEARKLRDEIAALPRHVAALESKAKTVAAQRAVVLDLIAKEESLRRHQESDVKDHQAKMAKIRKQLDLATDTKQVTAFEHEIAFAQSAVAKLEDAELESMLRSEELDAQKKVADQALESAQSAHRQEHDRAVATVDRNNLALKDLDGRRSAQRASIPESSLSLYDRIAKNKGTAVAEALAQKCSACQMMLRPQRWNDLRERDFTEMMSCDSCGRLLFYDPARDSPQRKPVDAVKTESIAVQIVRGR